MTTIAFDGRYLAADRLCNASGTKERVHKIFRCARFLYGGCGPTGEVMEVAHWLRSGAAWKEAPEFSEAEVRGVAVRVGKSPKAFLVCGKTARLMPIAERFFAAGSGRDAARAALFMGASARDAVLIAAKVDLCTGLGVDVVDARIVR